MAEVERRLLVYCSGGCCNLGLTLFIIVRVLSISNIADDVARSENPLRTPDFQCPSRKVAMFGDSWDLVGRVTAVFSLYRINHNFHITFQIRGILCSKVIIGISSFAINPWCANTIGSRASSLMFGGGDIMQHPALVRLPISSGKPRFSYCEKSNLLT